MIREEQGEDGQLVKIIESTVIVTPSDHIDPETAPAISKVSKSSTGAITIEMHNKPDALGKLARALGLFNWTRPHATLFSGIYKVRG